MLSRHCLCYIELILLKKTGECKMFLREREHASCDGKKVSLFILFCCDICFISALKVEQIRPLVLTVCPFLSLLCLLVTPASLHV